MHAQVQLAHLDVSLENVLVCSLPSTQQQPNRYRVVVNDFGLARRLRYANAQGEEVKFDAQNPMKCFELKQPAEMQQKPGKVQYMSPEILGGKPFIASHSDSWSLGVLLFMLLTGIPPFQRPDPSDQRFKYIVSGRLHELIRLWRIDLDSNAIDLLQRLLCYESKRLTIHDILSHPFITSHQRDDNSISS